jgi:hypothetical protein
MAGIGDPIDMDIKYIHENRHPPAGAFHEFRFTEFFDSQDLAVGGRYDQFLVIRCVSPGIAKEPDNENRDQKEYDTGSDRTEHKRTDREKEKEEDNGNSLSGDNPAMSFEGSVFHPHSCLKEFKFPGANHLLRSYPNYRELSTFIA